MSDLIRRMREARETKVDIAGFSFTLRRPTKVERYSWAREGIKDVQILGKCVVGWKGVKESDLVPSGGSIDVPFDIAVLEEWVGDRDDILMPLLDGIKDLIATTETAKDDALKN
jgi:hypothetical protein